MTLPAGAVRDAVGGPFAGIPDGQYRFSTSDAAAPAVVAYAPAQGATGVLAGAGTPRVVLTFCTA